MVALHNCGIKDFFANVRNKRVYAFGASKTIDSRLILRTPDYDIRSIIWKIVDNDVELQGTEYKYLKGKIEIISPNDLCKSVKQTDVILITSVCYGDIVKQLDEYRELDGGVCYILSCIDDYPDGINDPKLLEELKADDFLIPPVIHYCWFGKKNMPPKYVEYIENWKVMCPNYEFMYWNESNYDITQSRYMKWAYDNEKWAFVSDYARLDILYNYGGIYLDVDVELVKSLDELRKLPAYIGFESTQMVDTGLGIGSQKNNKVIKMFLDYYDQYIITSEFDMTPCTVHQSNVLRNLGVRMNNSLQYVGVGNCDMVILPTEYLCGERMNTGAKQVNENTVSIHHYLGEWGGNDKVERKKKKQIDYKHILERIKPSLTYVCEEIG